MMLQGSKSSARSVQNHFYPPCRLYRQLGPRRRSHYKNTAQHAPRLHSERTPEVRHALSKRTMMQMPARRHRRTTYVPSLPAFNCTPRADDDGPPLLGDAQPVHHRTSRMSRTGNARGRPPGRASLLPSSHAGERMGTGRTRPVWLWCESMRSHFAPLFPPLSFVSHSPS